MKPTTRQIDQVYDAVITGSRTSPEVADVTGLSVKHCSHYLRELESKGQIVQKGFLPGAGRRAKFYVPRAEA